MQRENKLQYLELKSKLTALNYTEPFKEDACDLVGRLVTDLVSTTNSYKVLQEKEARLASDLALSQAQLFPLRKENARLARENHDLHNDTIRLNDEIKSSSDDYLRQLQRAQEQLQDSRFLCESLQEQLKQKTDSIDRLRTAYDAVSDPSLKAPGNIGGNTNRAIKMSTKLSGRGGQVAELEVLHQSNKIEGAVDALVAEKDTIIRTLRTQLETANKSFVNRDEECRRLSSAVAAREQEIARSSKIISSGAASRAGGLDTSSGMQLSGNIADQYVAADTANKRIIDQLNGQVDFLNNELAKREAQLVDVNDKLLQYDALRAELMHRNVLLDQARKEASQSSTRVRALEQKVLAYQNAHVESAAAVELAQNAASSPSPESKQQEGAAKEAELRMLLGKASAERDELREEVARLRRIATTLSLPSSSVAQSNNMSLRPSSVGKRSGTAGAPGITRNASSKAHTSSLKATEKDEQLAKTNVLVIELNEEIETLKKKLHVTERVVAQRQEQMVVLERERDDWQRRVHASEERKDRSTLQQLHTDLQEQYMLCQQQLAESNRERSQLRGLSEAATGDLATLRAQLQEERLAKEEAETRLVFESKDLALSRQTAKKQSDDLSHLATETARLRMDCEDLREEVAREKMRSDSAQKMAAEAQALLDNRSAELVDANHQLALLHTGTSSVAGPGESEDQLRKDRHRLQIKLQELESQQLVWQRETRALQRIAQSLGVIAQQERAARGQVEEHEVVSVLDAVARKDRELAQAQHDLLGLKAALQREQAETSALQEEVCRLKLEVRGMFDQCAEEQHVASQLRSDLELAQQRLEKLRGDQEDALRRQMDAQHLRAGSDQHLLTLRSELKEKSDVLVRMQHALDAAEEHRDVLKRQLDDAISRSRSDKAELQQAVIDRQQLQVRCEEQQILVGNLETSLRAHSHTHTRLTAEVERGGEDQQLWEQERVRLQSALAVRDNRVREQQEALQSLDRERDRLQEHLDAAEEHMQQLKSAQTQMEMKLSAQVKVQEQTDRKQQAITAELTSAQRYAHAADARVQAAQLEITELKRRLSQKSVEVGGASKDLMAMTRENQALTSELVQVSRERDQLQHRLQQVLHQSAGNEHARRAAEVERTDLLNTYRAVLQEKRRLEEDVASLSTIKEREGHSVQQLQDKLANLQGTMAAQSAAEARWRGERAALLSQLDALNDHLVRTQHKLEAAEAENRKMMQDTSGLKQNNVMLNERINMIIKRAGAATEANKLLTGRLGAVERERDAVRALVGIERQRAMDMGHLAESARAESASKELHLQRLRAAAGSPGESSNAAAGSAGTTSHYYALRTSQQQARGGATGSYSSSPSHSPGASPVQEPLERSRTGGDLQQVASFDFLAVDAPATAET